MIFFKVKKIMEDKKNKNILISLKEAEVLIFNHYLSIEKSRLDITNIKGALAVRLFIDKENLIDFEGNYIILFTSVNLFEIPEKDETLFKNHYKIPKGLLKLNKRKVRDTKEGSQMNILPKDDFDIEKYRNLRNALFGVYNSGYLMSSVKSYKATSTKVLQGFNSLSDFKKQFIKEVLKESKFPLLKVKIDKFVTNNFYRVVWWGKFIGDNYLSKMNLEEEDVKSVKDWLRGFLNFDDIEHLNRQLLDIPNELSEEIDFLLGYYFSAIYLERFKAEDTFFRRLYDSLKYENKEKMFSWISFFTSIFNPKLSSLYFVKSLQEETFKLECLAFELTQNNLEFVLKNKYHINDKKIAKQPLIIEYLTLKEGATKVEPQIIELEEAKAVYENNLFKDKWQTIGLETSEFESSDVIENSCYFVENKFNLELNSSIKNKYITFYIDENSKSIEKLKELKFKVKTPDKLLDISKKVLVGFIELGETPKLLHIYETYFRERIVNKFEKILFVLLVDLASEELQSLDFNKKLKSREGDLKQLFGEKVELVVKNKRTKNDTEIKRSLRNVLKKYNPKQIEVIDENFDNEQACWLIDSNPAYFIEDKNKKYYSFFNNHTK
ncbi:hypothetical protein AUW17_03730 [Tenacibaculum dicentrarchi]|nr:hypothetical protein AUW17_03730 [Tenacibaculum dicentrarchi]